MSSGLDLIAEAAADESGRASGGALLLMGEEEIIARARAVDIDRIRKTFSSPQRIALQTPWLQSSSLYPSWEQPGIEICGLVASTYKDVLAALWRRGALESVEDYLKRYEVDDTELVRERIDLGERRALISASGELAGVALALTWGRDLGALRKKIRIQKRRVSAVLLQREKSG